MTLIREAVPAIFASLIDHLGRPWSACFPRWVTSRAAQCSVDTWFGKTPRAIVKVNQSSTGRQPMHGRARGELRAYTSFNRCNIPQMPKARRSCSCWCLMTQASYAPSMRPPLRFGTSGMRMSLNPSLNVSSKTARVASQLEVGLT